MFGSAIDWLGSLFSVRKPEMVENPYCGSAFYAALEARISRAGRERVFEIVRENGWGSHNAPPTHVWWAACDQALKEKTASYLAKKPFQGSSLNSNTAQTHDDK